MSEKKIIEIINRLRVEGITVDSVRESAQNLEEIGFKYNEDRFPKLDITQHFDSTNLDSPSNLAEALLWKLGKWNSYVNFCDYYEGKVSLPKKTDVVFYAFSRHLAEPDKKPIYDQHTLRAMYRINPKLSNDEINKIETTLFNNKKEWKATMSGKHTMESYNIYCNYIDDIRNNNKNLGLGEIDRLLMPLGQSIKKALEI